MPGMKPGMTEIYGLLTYAVFYATTLTLIAVPALTFDSTFTSPTACAKILHGLASRHSLPCEKSKLIRGIFTL